jgi:lipopolysaccharide/colanic/teichoic acid biosynthesis glycosyltransferase
MDPRRHERVGGAGRPPAVARQVKSVLDRVAAAVLLLLLSPLLLLVAAAVRLGSPGGAIFRRRVLGLHGRPFEALKFRTMVDGAERLLREDPVLSAAWAERGKLPEDPRVTALGRVLRRTSVDELPQLVNVLRGEMSLVGPRILTAEEASRFPRELDRRLSVLPGLTGLWQVSGRQETGYERRFELDLDYVERWSLRLDLEILLRTIPAVLARRGAY